MTTRGSLRTIALVAVGAAASLLATPLMAQELVLSPAIEAANQRQQQQRVLDEFDRAYFSNDPDFFENRSLFRQFNYMFGQGILVRDSFPENEIARDGKAVEKAYRRAMKRQMASGPVIRTLDMPNPYNTSLRVSGYASSRPNPIPPLERPPLFVPGPSVSEPIAPVPAPAPSPIPALW